MHGEKDCKRTPLARDEGIHKVPRSERSVLIRVLQAD